MRAALVAVLVVGCLGCYNPSIPSGVPCALPEHPCPGGEACIAGLCGGGAAGNDGGADVDAFLPGPPDDLDDDGVKNGADNCPMKPNATQHDEEADGVGDVCDNCPHLANADQTDGDTDGVGDTCDPHPAAAGDSIAKFFAFDSAPQGVTTMGTWTLTNDTYKLSGFSDAALVIDGTHSKVTVEAAGTVDDKMTNLWISVTVGEANNKYYDCGYLDFGGNPVDFHTAVIERYDGNDWEFLQGNHDLQTRLSGRFTVRVTADTATKKVTCRTIDTRGTANSTENTAGSLVSGGVALRSQGAAYHLDYMIVFDQK